MKKETVIARYNKYTAYINHITNETNRSIFIARAVLGMTFPEIAKENNITKERAFTIFDTTINDLNTIISMEKVIENTTNATLDSKLTEVIYDNYRLFSYLHRLGFVTIGDIVNNLNKIDKRNKSVWYQITKILQELGIEY